ncbi:MAG: OmpA/MotB family protein [Alphaproteobacteria bacterium]
MVTFADLMALMLAFFVLLFSMSQIQRQKWQSIVESLASHQSATYETETAKYAADYQVAAPIIPPGADLDYLEPVLRDHFAAEPMLAGGLIERVEGGLGISFPDERLFVGSTPKLTARGTKVISALGSVLRSLNNAVDVNARMKSGATVETGNWETTLARSVAVARILAQSGYSGSVVARGRGSQIVGADGLDLLVREDRRG